MSDSKWKSPVEKGLWKTLWPILGTHLLGISLNFADTIFMSRINDVAAGAIGAMFPVVMLYQMLFSTVAQCGVNVGSQYLGKKDRKKMKISFSAGIQLSALIGVVVALLMTFCHPILAKTLGLEAKALHFSLLYFSVLAPMIWVRALGYVYGGILNAIGKGKWNIALALGNNLINIVLNFAFLEGFFGEKWQGVQGLALATVLSQALTILFMLFFVHGVCKIPFLLKAPWRYRSETIDTIMGIALPAAIEPIAFQLAQLCFAWGYVQLGNLAMATRIYTMNILIWVILWNISLGIANQILISEHIGARNFEAANQQMMRTIRLGITGAVVGLIPLSLLSNSIFGVFSDNPEIARIGGTLLLLSFFLETGRAANLVIGGSLRASGDSTYITVVSILVLFVFVVPSALGLMLPAGLGYGLVGLWIAMSADEWVRGFLNFQRWRQGHWQHKGINKQK